MSRNKTLLALAVSVVLTVGFASSAWAAGKYKTLHQFSAPQRGRQPAGGLIFDSVGNLYGTTIGGGAQGYGTVFQLTPTGDGTWKEKVPHSFHNADGSSPSGSLALDVTGNLYGTTVQGGNPNCQYGCGVVFELKPNGDGTWKEKVLHSFSQKNEIEGYAPVGGVILDPAGNLYGTTSQGSSPGCENYAYYCGAVFELTHNPSGTWKEKVLYSFNSSPKNGRGPWAGVTFDSAGNLYGTTSQGGYYGFGTAFELTPNGNGNWKEKVIHSFGSGGDGVFPQSGLIFDSAGNLYGTTFTGGSFSRGTVFELTPNGDGTWTEKLLHSFNFPDGNGPQAPLIFDSPGNLYGTTTAGGDNGVCLGQGCGVVFKLTPNGNGGWMETVLHSFRDMPGSNPYSGLVFDGNGNLYGTTLGDYGKTTFGSVFEISP
jgi:uncharacterized repeat protein (TIGR03803 family)